MGYNESVTSIILATTDGGTSWTAPSSGALANTYLYGAACANSSDGWAVGYNFVKGTSVILATANGGTSWNAQSSAATADERVFGIACASSSDAWAVGEGVILATTDGGGYAAPTLSSFTPTSAAVGATVTLTGTNFTGAGEVTFNGLSAKFTVNSDTQVSTTVPSGATSGKIAVTTPGGTATSAASFTVLVTPHLTLKLSGLTFGFLNLGKRLTAKGTVNPSTSPTLWKVRLTAQRKQGGKWRKVQSVQRTASAKGAYGWTFKPKETGAYRIRATIAKTATHTAAATKWLRFKVR